jgi:hypothetical protein
MIFSLPYNESVQGRLPTQPTPDQIQKFLARVRLAIENKGYVIGPEGMYLGPFGEIMVDLVDVPVDRDPVKEWANIVVPDKTPAEVIAEKAAQDDLSMIRLALPKLQANTLPALQVQKVISWLVQRELARINSG